MTESWDAKVPADSDSIDSVAAELSDDLEPAETDSIETEFAEVGTVDTDSAETKVGAVTKKKSLLRELVVVGAIVLGMLWVSQTFITRQYVIPSESMEPTLHGCTNCKNDRVIIDKVVYRFHDPEPGDVVVFKGPTDSWNAGWVSPRSNDTTVRSFQNMLSWFGFQPPNENDFVKRVIAVGGQRISCKHTEGVKVDGKLLSEPYINRELQSQTGDISPCLDTEFDFQIPKGFVWVMGDNRNNSGDSRAHIDDEYHGMIPVKNIRGKVRLIIYPVSRWSTVDSVNPQK